MSILLGFRIPVQWNAVRFLVMLRASFSIRSQRPGNRRGVRRAIKNGEDSLSTIISGKKKIVASVYQGLHTPAAPPRRSQVPTGKVFYFHYRTCRDWPLPARVVFSPFPHTNTERHPREVFSRHILACQGCPCRVAMHTIRSWSSFARL